LVAAAATGTVLDVDRLPARTPDGRTVVASSEDVVVADVRWAQVSRRPHLVVPSAAADVVAEMLDLDLAAEVGSAVVHGSGERADVPSAVAEAFPTAPTRWVEHEELVVDGVEVSWWVAPGPTVHASTTAGLARGLAWVVGWEHRSSIERLLLDPDALADVL